MKALLRGPQGRKNPYSNSISNIEEYYKIIPPTVEEVSTYLLFLENLIYLCTHNVIPPNEKHAQGRQYRKSPYPHVHIRYRKMFDILKIHF